MRSVATRAFGVSAVLATGSLAHSGLKVAHANSLDPLNLGGMAAETTLRNPGKFDEVGGMSKQILGFEGPQGATISISTAVFPEPEPGSPMMEEEMPSKQCRLGFKMGVGGRQQDGKSFQINTETTLDKHRHILLADFDFFSWDSSGKHIFSPNKQITTSTEWSITPSEPEYSSLSSGADYAGKDFTASFRYDWLPEAAYHLSYAQSLTESVIAGVGIIQSNQTNCLRGFAQYSNVNHASRDKAGDTIRLEFDSRGIIAPTYQFTVAENLLFATDLKYYFQNRETVCTAGYMLHGMTSVARAKVDSTGKVCGSLQTQVAGGIQLSISAVVNHENNENSFGFSLGI